VSSFICSPHFGFFEKQVRTSHAIHKPHLPEEYLSNKDMQSFAVQGFLKE